MKGTKPDNKTLDAIGKRLICSSTPNLDEIEKLISDPQLFERVTARIGTGGLDALTAIGSGRWFASFLRSRSLRLTGALAALALATFSITVFRASKPMVTALEVQFPEPIPAFARPDSPPKFIDELSPGRATFSDIPVSEPRHVVKTVYHPPRDRSPIENDGEFYELSVGSDPNGTLGGGRIVRVDIKRSSLLALGVNLPLENESETVRADLLVSPDGVTRAFRLVK